MPSRGWTALCLAGGGTVVAESTREVLVHAVCAFTGEYLRPVLEVLTLAAD